MIARSFNRITAYFIFFFLFISFNSKGQPGSSKDLENILRNNLPAYKKLFDNKFKYRLQIIYIQIDRDKNNVPHFTQYDFNNNSNLFYCCASTVKLPSSIFALEKVRQLNINGLTKDSPMLSDSAFYCQNKVFKDTTNSNCLPSIAHYIRKMLLVSDNYSFGKVYEFLTCDYLHEKFSASGFPNIRIVNKLDGACPGDTSKIAPPIYFLNDLNDTIYKQSLLMRSTFNKPVPVADTKVGVAYVNENGKKATGSRDFKNHNYISMQDQVDILKTLVFNSYINSTWKIDSVDRSFLLKEMGMYPRESIFPQYDPKEYYDSYKKYLLYGSMTAHINVDSLRIFNIVGRAYGFLTDCAYVVDLFHKVEFIIAATVYVNEKGVVGSGNYQYNNLGLPFMRDLGKFLYQNELKRQKEYLPNLSEFNFYH